MGTDAAGSRTARASHHGTSLVTLRGKLDYHVLMGEAKGGEDRPPRAAGLIKNRAANPLSLAAAGVGRAVRTATSSSRGGGSSEKDMRLKLSREWVLGSRIDGGGFGQVYNATCPDPDIGPSVAKLVPKAPGAQRETLFVNLAGIRNVVPIIDSGETEDSWALVMPRADKSLRQHMRGEWSVRS